MFKEKMIPYFGKNDVNNPYNLSSYTRRSLFKYYTQQSFECDWLNEMILSPRSFGKVDTNGRKYLGCYQEGKHATNKRKENDDEESHPVKFCIANGLTIGFTPKCIQKLNEVELALISKGRCEKHIFSYTGGAHKQIRGWHTIYENNVTPIYAVLNYFDQHPQVTEEH